MPPGSHPQERESINNGQASDRLHSDAIPCNACLCAVSTNSQRRVPGYGVVHALSCQADYRSLVLLQLLIRGQGTMDIR